MPTGAATPTLSIPSVTITFACKDYQHEQYQALADAFGKENPGIAVRILSTDEITGNEPGVATSEDTAKIAAAADTFLDYASMVVEVAVPQGVILDLSPLAREDGDLALDDFYPAPLSLLQREGKLWGLPASADVTLIYYDAERLRQAGAPLPAIGWEWDDLLQAAKLTTSEGEAGSEYGFVDARPAATVLLIAMQKAGPLMDDAGRPRLDDPALGEALAWYTDLFRQHGIMPDPLTDIGELQQRRGVGSAALWTGTSFELNNFGEAGIAPFPGTSGPVSSVTAYGYFVSAGTAHPEEAWRWVEFLSRQSTRLLPGSIPARRSVAESSGVWESLGAERAEVLQHCLANSVYLPGPLYGAVHAAQEAYLGGEPLEVALALAQEEAERRLGLAQATAAERTPTFAVPSPTPEPTPGGTIVRFAAPWALTVDAYRTLAAEFAASHPDVTIELTENSTAYDFRERLRTSDCLLESAAWLDAYGTDGLLALDALLDESSFSLEPYPAFALEQATVEGSLYGLPLEIDAQFLFYNADILESAGIAYPDASWAAETLVERAIALTDASAGVYGFYPGDGVYFHLPGYLRWLVARLLAPDGRPSLDDPSVTDALMRYAELVSRAAPPEALESDNVFGVTVNEHSERVEQGRVALWTESYGICAYKWLPRRLCTGLAPLPLGDGVLDPEPPYVFYISAQAGDPGACWQWITFLSQDPRAITFLPLRQDLVRGDAWRDYAGAEVADAWGQMLAGEGEAWLPLDARGADTERYWLNEALAQVLAGRDPVAALDEAQDRGAVVYDCMQDSDGSFEDWIACGQQADPDVRLP